MEISEAIECGLVCPNCSGNGGGWPEVPTICGGARCPVCDGVCELCLGDWDGFLMKVLDRTGCIQFFNLGGLDLEEVDRLNVHDLAGLARVFYG